MSYICKSGFEVEDLNEVIGIYSEDIEILRKNNIDLKGFIDKKSSILYNCGYERALNLIKVNDNKYKCYYFDEKQNKCSIHEFAPIVCKTYPYRINNWIDKCGVRNSNSCYFNNEIIDDYDKFAIDNLKRISYIEYSVAIAIFLLNKDRVVFHNNRLVPNTKFLEKFINERRKINET